MTDFSQDRLERVIMGLRPMDGSNEMDAGVSFIEDLWSERERLRGCLSAVREVLKRMDFSDQSIAIEGIDQVLFDPTQIEKDHG